MSLLYTHIYALAGVLRCLLALAGSSSVIHGVLTNTVVICHRVSPVSRRRLGGDSACRVIHGQDAVSCTKASVCMKQREKERRRRRKREKERGSGAL